MISHIGTKATLAPQDLYPDHTHHCFEITYIHEGCGFMHTANGDMPFEKNSFYIIPPNAIHSLVSANGHIATSMLTRNERLSSIRDVMWARDVVITSAVENKTIFIFASSYAFFSSRVFTFLPPFI
ncbi:MAG: hypothetical protein E7676_03525 [Ruminococcaceae bacterium]|nr:hypothetical protein [Oscillospiraceae bacterium]